MSVIWISAFGADQTFNLGNRFRLWWIFYITWCFAWYNSIRHWSCSGRFSCMWFQYSIFTSLAISFATNSSNSRSFTIDRLVFIGWRHFGHFLLHFRIASTIHLQQKRCLHSLIAEFFITSKQIGHLISESIPFLRTNNQTAIFFFKSLTVWIAWKMCH